MTVEWLTETMGRLRHIISVHPTLLALYYILALLTINSKIQPRHSPTVNKNKMEKQLKLTNFMIEFEKKRDDRIETFTISYFFITND